MAHLKVLFPLDGSKVSYEAMMAAIRMLQGRPGLQLTALNVMQEMKGAPEHLIEQAEADEEDELFPTEEASRKCLETAVEMARSEGVTLATRIRRGNVSNEILAEAADHDLLVIHGLGRSSLKDVFRLSTGERIVRRAPCSVLVVRLPNAT